MYLLLLILWLVLNGRITPELVLLGLGLVALLGVVIRGLFGYSPRRELRFYRCLPLFLAYLAVLFWQILKANITVIRLIFAGPKRIEPVLIRVRVDLKTSMARYILANSITLTPGTITVRSEDGILTIHCLSASLMEDVENGVFVRLLRRMEA